MILLQQIFIPFFAALIMGMSFIYAYPLFSYKPILLYAYPLLVCFSFLTLMNPEFIWLILILIRVPIEPIAISSRIGGGMGFGAVLNLLVIGLSFVFLAKRGRSHLEGKFVLAWAIFLFVCFAASLYSPYRVSGLRLAMTLLTFCCVANLPFLLVQKQQSTHKWFFVLQMSVLIPVLFGNVDLLLGGIHGGRVKSFFNHPNQFAFFLNFTIVLNFLIYKCVDLSKYLRCSKKLSVFLMLNALVLLFATQTRSAWIGAFLFFLIYGIFCNKRIFFLTILLPALAFFLEPVQERIMDLAQGNERVGYTKLNSFAWRVELWKSAFPEFLKRPLFGYGFASFKPLAKNFFELATRDGAGAHSVFVKLAFETGVVGLFAYLNIFLAYLFKILKLEKGNKQIKVIFGGYLISYLIICASDNLLYYLTYNWYFWFFMGLGLKLLCTESEEKNEDSLH